jgi:putative transposase
MGFKTRRQTMNEVIDRLTYYNHRRLNLTLVYICQMRIKQYLLAAQLKDTA